MISYPDEASVSSLNIQPENPISDAWYWYPNPQPSAYNTDSIYQPSTQPENREFIERTYVDSSCPFPSGRFYKVNRVYPGKGYLLLNRGSETCFTVQEESDFNKVLGGNDITIYKGWNFVSTPKNDEAFVLQPSVSTNSETIWHWEHNTPSTNINSTNILDTQPETTVNIVSSGGNKYVFNGESTYDSSLKVGLKKQTYIFKGISNSHPMAIRYTFKNIRLFF